MKSCNPELFARYNLRSGSMICVAFDVDEGSVAIKFMNEYLAENYGED